MPTPDWQPLTTYAAGQKVKPTVRGHDGYYFVAATGGVSGATEPAWATTGTIADGAGSLTWTPVGPIGPDYGQARVGATLFPLPVGSGLSLLQVADPALYYFLDWVAWVVNSYAGLALQQAFQQAGVAMPGGLPPAQAWLGPAIAQAYPYEPTPEQLENQFRFPLLAVYRKHGDTEWTTIGHEADATALEVLYVLPPLDAAASELVLPAFAAIPKILRRKTTDAWDPNYAPPGGKLGDQFDSAPYANLQEVGFGQYRGFLAPRGNVRFWEQGFLEGKEDGVYMPCLRMQAYFVERDEYDPTAGGPVKVAGGDVALSLGADDGTTVANLVQVAAQPAPLVSQLSPATLPASSGGTVTVTGGGFLAGARVFLGPAASPTWATSVAFVSSTQLTVAVPAMSGAGAVDITVQNRDGQRATLAAGLALT